LFIAAIRYREKAESCTSVTTPHINTRNRDYGPGSFLGAIGNVTVPFNGGDGGDYGSIPGDPKMF
jgi:hypothetical protein